MLRQHSRQLVHHFLGHQAHFVTRNARSLGVRGTVRNRDDGALEAVLQADDSAPVDELVDRMCRGPRAARVDSVDVERVDRERMNGFEVVR